MVLGLLKKSVNERWFVGGTAIAILSSTIATTSLQHWSMQATQHKLQLSRLKSAANRLDAIEWRAISQQKDLSELQALMQKHHQKSEAILTKLKSTAISSADLQTVVSTYNQYFDDINELLALLNAGKIAEALEIEKNKAKVDSEKLQTLLDKQVEKAASTAQAVGTYAFVGTILTNLVLLLIIAGIFRRYQNVNRKIQTVLVEQEKVRCSEQVLRQERALLEAKVAERTQALEDKNETLTQVLAQLKQSQLQLVQSEKMSSLGQLVAGVAHEINNPINFISGNLFHINSHTTQLISLVEAYQEEVAHPSPVLQEKLEETELDFLSEDMAKILGSMKTGTDRIREIILSLRNFSRLDEAECKVVDVHEGINNTLLILQHRFNPTDDRDAIQVIQEYGNLPLVKCYPGLLNQVFINLLNNAIDALDAASCTRTKDATEPYLPTVWIKTEADEQDFITITIVDNGIGIPEEMRSRIFDPFFTTKPVGKGTGLGLSVSYQIVTAQHGGQLSCDSTVDQETKFTIKIPRCS